MTSVVTSEDIDSTLSVVNDEPLDIFMMDHFLSRQTEFERIPFNIVRLIYIYHIFNKIRISRKDFPLGCEFVSAVDEILRRGGSSSVVDSCAQRTLEEFDCLDMGYKLHRLTPQRQLRLFKVLEKASRGQAENAVWHTLRIDTISATRFYDALATGCVVPSATSESDRIRLFCEGVRFGTEHEPVVKALIEVHVACRREPIKGGLGVLLDPSSGILGASLDLCFGVEEDGSETINVQDKASIFEIKCRFKYLRSRNDPAVEGLLQNPCLPSLAAFLRIHPVSAVEYRSINDVPSGREFLISHDVIFRGTKRSRAGVVPDIFKSYIERLIRLNEGCESLAIVFDVDLLEDETLDECVDTISVGKRLRLYEKARFDVPAFVNPRHPYYCQTLVQQYVLSQYYIRDHPNPERIDCQDLPTVNLVSAVLRKRSEVESTFPLYVGNHVFECESIPLFLIVTPVVIDPIFTRDAVNCVLNLWKREIGKRTGLPLWVLNAVNEYVSSSIPTPPSP